MEFEPSRRVSDEERILPLINIVFLLLIFFMLAGRLAVSDPFRIDPPRSTSEAAAQQRDMIVLVGAQGRLALDGEIMEQARIQSTVAKRVSGGDSLGVLVRADGQAEAIRVMEVMELLQEAGLENLKLLTLPEED